MRKCGYLMVLALLLVAGCDIGPPESTGPIVLPLGEDLRPTLRKGSGGYALSVGIDTVTADEVIELLLPDLGPAAKESDDFEQFERQVRKLLENVVVTKATSILLYQQARRQVDEQVAEAMDKMVEEQVRKFVASYEGDYARAEQALRRDGMDWDSYRKTIFSQIYVGSQLPRSRPITYRELRQCYDRVKDERFAQSAQMKFELLDIEVARLKVTDPNQCRQERAKKLADELVTRIQAGEDLRTLAGEHGGVSYIRFGDPIEPESLTEPYDALATEAEKLNPGNISRPIDAGDHILIMKLEEKRAKSYRPFEQVQSQVERMIIAERQQQAREEVRAKLVQEVTIGQTSEFVDFCLRRIYQMGRE